MKATKNPKRFSQTKLFLKNYFIHQAFKKKSLRCKKHTGVMRDMRRQRTIGVVELGTAKVGVLVGQIQGPGRMAISGAALEPSVGVKKGTVVDLKSLSEATHAALQKAEDQAGKRLDHVYLAQSGGHLQGASSRGRIRVRASDNCVSEQDIERATEEARSKELKPDRVFIHHMRAPFLLDGRPVTDPMGMQGEWLESTYWSVHGDARSVGDAIHVVNAYGVKVDEVVLSSIASALLLTQPEEREQGVLVLDIGAGTTDYVVYSKGVVAQTGVLPVGGDHITNDLSLGLRIGKKEAEALKKRHARATPDASKGETSLSLQGELVIGERKVLRKSVDAIVHARLEELFMLVAEALQPHIELKKLSAGALLTGGCSQLPEIETLAATVFNLTTRIGELPPWVGKELRSAHWATPLGLLHCAWTQQGLFQDTYGGRGKGLLNNLTRWLGVG